MSCSACLLTQCRQLPKAQPERPQLVVLAKLDLTEARDGLPTLRAQFADRGVKLWAISAATGEGVAELMDEAYRLTHSQLQQRSSAA